MGAITGFLNGFFGSGGGLIAVPLLSKSGMEQKKAHATSIALTLSLSIVSTGFYFYKDAIDLKTAIKYIPTGLIGAFIGTLILKKIKPDTLKKIFAAILVFSGVWMMFR